MAASRSGTDAVAAIIGIIIAVLVILGGAYGLRHAISYSMQNSHLAIRLLGITVQRVPFSHVDRVEVIPFTSEVPLTRSFRADMFVSLKWCGYREKVVAITKRTGLVKRVIVSAEDPDEFASFLRRASGSVRD